MEPDKLTYQLMRFGQRMKEIRKYKELTLQNLEAATGMHNSKISKIENGQVNVEFNTIARLAEALGVEIMDLFDYDGPLPKSK
ncbi:MAG: helix-turn-helix transcriptional regulator [Niastella sp.]|nr:helix-turn-helix transcriptional regulator [Niastella sp.]